MWLRHSLIVSEERSKGCTKRINRHLSWFEMTYTPVLSNLVSSVVEKIIVWLGMMGFCYNDIWDLTGLGGFDALSTCLNIDDRTSNHTMDCAGYKAEACKAWESPSDHVHLGLRGKMHCRCGWRWFHTGEYAYIFSDGTYIILNSFPFIQ